MFAVPEDEPNEKTYSHDGEPQIDVPSVQHPCRHDRAQGGQDQQQGSPALREFLLFDHSRFSSRRREAHSASHQRFFLALSSRQLAAQVHNLTYMMIRMPGPAQRTKIWKQSAASGSRSAVYAFPQSSVFCFRIVVTTMAIVRSNARSASSLGGGWWSVNSRSRSRM